MGHCQGENGSRLFSAFRPKSVPSELVGVVGSPSRPVRERDILFTNKNVLYQRKRMPCFQNFPSRVLAQNNSHAEEAYSGDAYPGRLP